VLANIKKTTLVKNTIILLSIILLLVSCEKKKIHKDDFNLTVTAKNFPDSTKVYLYDENLEIKLDSTYVVNESFKISGKVNLPSLSYLFFHDSENKRSEDYKYLFIENKDISIEGEYLDFFNSKVTGSNQTDLLSKYKSLSENSDKSKKVSNQLNFLYSHANNQMALNELLYKKKEVSKDSLLLFYKKLDSINSNSPKGQALLAYTKKVNIKIGDKFRDISGNDLKGVQHKLSDYFGKVILLNFWSPDCPYSSQQQKKEFPKLVQKYNLENFIIISYFIDKEKEEWEKSGENKYDNWLYISDLKGMKGKNISEYDVTGPPNSFLIDKSGIVVKSFIGYYEGDNSIEKKIDEILNK
jgi:glutathione peroxidase-family protein